MELDLVSDPPAILSNGSFVATKVLAESDVEVPPSLIHEVIADLALRKKKWARYVQSHLTYLHFEHRTSNSTPTNSKRFFLAI